MSELVFGITRILPDIFSSFFRLHLFRLDTFSGCFSGPMIVSPLMAPAGRQTPHLRLVAARVATGHVRCMRQPPFGEARI